MIAVNEEQELELESPKSETMKGEASTKQQLFVSAMPDSPNKMIAPSLDDVNVPDTPQLPETKAKLG